MRGWRRTSFAWPSTCSRERNEDDALVLAGGVPWGWLDGNGVALSGLYTPHGRLSYTLRRRGDRVLLHVDAGLRMPKGGIVLTWPGPAAPGTTRVNGKITAWRDGELRILQLPADVVVERAASNTRKP